MTKWNPKTIAWWHEQLADWMLLNPDRTIRDAAKVFNVGENYLYLLKNSDSFKAYWEFRRKQQVEKIGDVQIKNLSGGIAEKVNAMADMALDQILDQLDKNGKMQGANLPPIIPHDSLRSTVDMALKKLGYGLPQVSGASPISNTQVNVTINAETLAAAREKMKQLHGVETVKPLEIEGKVDE